MPRDPGKHQELCKDQCRTHSHFPAPFSIFWTKQITTKLCNPDTYHRLLSVPPNGLSPLTTHPRPGRLTREHSRAKMAAGPVLSSGSIRQRQRRRRKESVFRCLRWNFQPNREAYSHPSRSDSSGLCCGETTQGVSWVYAGPVVGQHLGYLFCT